VWHQEKIFIQTLATVLHKAPHLSVIDLAMNRNRCGRMKLKIKDRPGKIQAAGWLTSLFCLLFTFASFS